MPLRRRSFFCLLIAGLGLALSAAAPDARAADPAAYRRELLERANALHLSDDPYWRVLLHYRHRWLGGFKSEIGSKDFFNAPGGRRDPQAELAATIEAFFEAPAVSKPGQAELPQHPQCRFVDRYAWLKEKLAFDPALLPEQPCPEFRDWRAALDPGSVTLVFSSYYLNNPSSMFGHTLLRLNHKGHDKNERLLDYGVNYAAYPTTRNALLYGLLGMTGGFPGEFSNIPYFVKVQEYNNGESRDLWEYDLGLAEPQIDRMMRHLWAVGHIRTPYYFFDKNCSYMVLTLLDSANPDLHLSEDADGLWVIPADTVRAIARKPGLVREVTLRPALATRIRRQREGLSAAEDGAFLSLIHARDAEARRTAIASARALGDDAAIRVLDLAMDYLRFRKLRQEDKLAEPESSLWHETQLARSDLPARLQEIPVTDEEVARARPDQGHDTTRASLASGYDSATGSFAEVGFRPAFHDLNAATVGYPRSAQIDLLDTAFRWYPASARFKLDHVDFLDVLSLAPVDRVFFPLSWNVRAAVEPVRDLSCGECLEERFDVGGGLSLAPTRSLLLYALGQADFSFGGPYVPGYRLGPAATAGLLVQLSDGLSAHFSGTYVQPVLGFRTGFGSARGELRVSTSRSTDLRAGAMLFETGSEGGASFNVYF